jgi:cupin superfamily acireductone dioxygenase involved in methionine salvage
MKILKQSVPFILDSVQEHSAMKQTILEAIKSMGTHSLIEPQYNQEIFNTDYHLSAKVRRHYIHLMQPIVIKHLAKASEILSSTINANLISTSIWFQQYEKNNYHGWHWHEEAQYSSVYYLDLPEDASYTTFKYLDEEYEVAVSEGDILTFPSCICHCSKLNKSDKVKTVISFNSVFTQ